MPLYGDLIALLPRRSKVTVEIARVPPSSPVYVQLAPPREPAKARYRIRLMKEGWVVERRVWVLWRRMESYFLEVEAAEKWLAEQLAPALTPVREYDSRGSPL